MDLYVSDLDGTLLRGDATLSDFARRSLADLLADGMQFTVASARSVVTMRRILGDLPLRLPVIGFNGAYLSDLATGRPLWIGAIGAGQRDGILGHILACGCLPFVSSSDGPRESLYYETLGNEGMAAYHTFLSRTGDSRLRPPRPLRDSLGGQVVCFTVIDRRERLVDLEARLRESGAADLSLHLFEDTHNSGSWHWLTVHAAQATKERAIGTLREVCGLGDCRVTVFGDHLNDLGMMRAADRAVAVANAMPQVKECASLVLGPNEADSVVRFLLAEHGGQGGAG
ncbi:MAG: HAD family hydrolase [Candidatus Latescibacterota bacterium]